MSTFSWRVLRPSLADHPALGATAVHAVPLDRPARGRVYHGTGPHPDRDALFQHRGYPRLERQQRRRLGPRTPRLPRQPVAAGGGAHPPRRGRHDPREGQPRLYDPADRGKLHLHAGELPHFQPVPEASGKPGRSVGNRGPALFRKGQARAFRSRFRQGGYALPLYGRPCRQGKLHPVHQDKKVGDVLGRHQRIHLRRAPFCSGDRTQAHHRLAFGIIGIIGMVGIGGATFQINQARRSLPKPPTAPRAPSSPT